MTETNVIDSAAASAATGTTQTETAAQTAPAEKPFNIGDYIEPDGRFKPGWKEALLPEDLRPEKFYDVFSDVKGILKTAGTDHRMIGKKGVIVPTEKSSQSEVDAYRQAIGVPQDVSGYKWQKPDDIHIEDMSPEFTKGVLTEFHKAGYTPKQAETALNYYTNHLRGIEKALDMAEQQEFQIAEQKIREESGAAYDQRLHLANRMIEENTRGWSTEKKDAFLSAINENNLRPYVMDFLANVGGKFMEHKIIAEPEQSGIMTPAMAKTEIAKLEATPGFIVPDENGKYMKNDGRIELYKSLAAERDRLYRLANAGR
jgi:hypothetical protein